MLSTDVLIVGAGPVGLEVAVALQRAGLDVLVVDAGAVGNTILTQFPHQTRFFSSPERLHIGGIDMSLPSGEKPTGDEYLAYLRSIVTTFDLQVSTWERVTSCRREDGWRIGTERRSGPPREIAAEHVVLATGGTQRHRVLGVEGEDLPHVHRLLGNPHRFFGRRVLVVGGRNSAAESALGLYRLGARTMLSYRGQQLHERVKYWLRPEVTALIEEGQIQGFMPTRVERIGLDHVALRHLGSGAREIVEVDDVLLQLGFEQDSSILRLFSVECDGDTQTPSFDPTTMETNVPGVWVAGTATAGTQQRFKVYIETSHVHAARIAAALTGQPPPDEDEFPTRLLPES